MVWIGGIQNVSGSNNGYGDFTNLSTPLTQGSTINGYLTATLPFGLSEYYRIWIDYNHDNDFTDAGEMAVDISSTFLGYISVNFTVPATALPGTTRMRVTMRFDSPPSPCGLYARGETEDYSVIIVSPFAEPRNSGINNKIENNELEIFPNPVSTRATASFHLKKTENVVISILDITGREIKNISTENLQPGKNKIPIDFSELKRGVYFCIIKLDEKLQAVKLIKE